MTAPGTALMDRARTGDARAFAELVRNHDPLLRRLAYRLLTRADRVDDVLQEAYVRAYRALPDFRGASGFGSWLYRITYNCCIDELRAAARRPQPVEDPAGDRAVPGSEPSQRIAVREAVRAALASLPEEQRAAVVLIDGEGLDYGSAANLLGVPKGTVASRVARARDALRRALENDRELLR